MKMHSKKDLIVGCAARSLITTAILVVTLTTHNVLSDEGINSCRWGAITEGQNNAHGYPYISGYSVFTKTNVAESSNQKGCKIYDMLNPEPNEYGFYAIPAILHHHHEGCGPYHPPTEKKVETTVLREWRFTIWRPGGLIYLTYSDPVTNWATRTRIDSTWVETDDVFSWEHKPHIWGDTNGIFTNIVTSTNLTIRQVPLTNIIIEPVP